MKTKVDGNTLFLAPEADLVASGIEDIEPGDQAFIQHIDLVPTILATGIA